MKLVLHLYKGMGPNLLEILLVFMNSVYLTLRQRDTAHIIPHCLRLKEPDQGSESRPQLGM